MLNLEELNFKVITGELDEALKKIDALTPALERLGNAQAKEAKAVREVTNAKLEQAKAESEIQKAAEKTAKVVKEVGDATEKGSESTDKIATRLGNLKNNLVDLSDGWTKGESSQLNYFRNLGANAEIIKEVEKLMEGMRKFFSDPFDNAIGPVRAITAELEKLQNRANLVSQGIALTNTQLAQYSKIAEQVAVQLSTKGVNLESPEGQAQYNKLLKEQQDLYLSNASAVNSLNNAEKARNDALKEQERLNAANIGMMDSAVANFRKLQIEQQNTLEANRKLANDSSMKEWAKSVGSTSQELDQLNNYYRNLEQSSKASSAAQVQSLQKVEAETKKLEFATSELAQGLNLGSQNKLYALKQDMEKAGIAGADLENRLKHIKELLIARQGKSELSRIARDSEEATEAMKKAQKQVDHLARAIGVQLGDVGVSLAAGQNPLTVLIQQGDQLRMAVANAKDAGADMSQAMQHAVTGIASSFIDTGKLVLGFVGNVVVQSGKMLSNSLIKFLDATTFRRFSQGLNAVMLSLAASADAGSKFSGFILTIVEAIPIVLGALTALAAVISGALLVGLYQAVKQQDELTKSLILTGGGLGLTSEAANDYVLAMTDVGLTTSEASKFITEYAKAGNLPKDQMMDIARAAAEMSKWFGISTEEVVKMYSELRKTPTEKLIEFAKASGLVSEAVLREVAALEEAGKKEAAYIEASQAMLAGQDEQVRQAKEKLSNFAIFITELGETISSFFDKAFRSVWYAADPNNEIDRQITLMEARISRAKNSPGLSATLGLTDSKESILGLERELELLKARKREIADAATKQATDQAKNKEDADSFKINNEWRKKEIADNNKLDSYDAKRMTRQAFLNAGFAEEMRLHAGLLDIAENRAISDEKYGKKWDEAQKKSNTEANKLTTYMEKTAERVRDLGVDLYANNVHLTKAGKLIQDLSDDPLWEKAPASWKAQQLALLRIADINENLIKQYDEQIKRQEKINNLSEQWAIESAKHDVQNQQANADIDFRVAIMGKSTKEVQDLTREYERQKKITQINADIEEKLLKVRKQANNIVAESSIVDRGNAMIAADKFYDEQSKELEKQRAERQVTVNREVAQQFAEDTYKEFENIRKGLSDVIYTAITQGGKAAAKSLAQFLKNEIARKIQLNIEANINTIMNMGGSGQTGSAGTLGGLINGLTDAISMWKTGGYTASLEKGVSTALDWAISNQYSELGSILASVGDTIVSVDNWLSTTFPDLMSGGLDSAFGYLSALNSAFNGDYGSAIGAAIGTYILPGIGTMIGSFLGSFANDWFGNAGTPHTGGAGSYSVSGGLQTGQNMSAVGAGWVWGGADAYDQTTANSMAEMSKAIVTTLNGVASSFGKQVGYFAAASFADDSSSDGAWGTLTIKLADKIVAGIGQDADKWAGTTFANGALGQQQFTDAVASQVLGVMKSMGLPEWANAILDKITTPTFDSLSQALTLLSQVNALVNVMSKSLGFSVTNLNKLIDSFGSVDAATSALTTYYDNFYSVQDKLTAVTNQLSIAFAVAGKQIPQTKSEFKAMVDQAMALGNTDLVAYLLSLQGGVLNMFDLMSQGIDQATSAWQDLTNTIFEEVNRIRGTIAVDSGKGLQYYQSQFDTNTQLALSGDQNAAKTLTELSKTIIDIAKTTSSSYEDYVTLQARIAASLQATGTALSNQYGLDIPAFASGGNYQGGLALVGEEGPELINFNSTGTVHTAAQTSSLLDTSQLADLLEKLNSRVDMLEAASRSTAITNNKIAKLLDRLAPEGDALQTRVVA